MTQCKVLDLTSISKDIYIKKQYIRHNKYKDIYENFKIVLSVIR